MAKVGIVGHRQYYCEQILGSALVTCNASAGVSNGSVEGMNNKAKLAMRKAYGFKSYETIETALYHQLGKLPEPIQTQILLTRPLSKPTSRLCGDLAIEPTGPRGSLPTTPACRASRDQIRCK